MPYLCYYNPNNPKQKYWTITSADPNIPAGFLDSQGSDGAIPEALQKFVAGINNQGAGAVGYLTRAGTDGDPNMRTAQPNWPNGVLNSPSGNRTGV